MKQEIRNQIRDLEKKIRDLTSKINQILSLGGIVPDKLNQELNALNAKKKELEATPSSDLELRFKKEHEKVTRQINKHLDKVYEELNKAISLSEEHGIPFSSEVRKMSDRYFPESWNDAWLNQLDNDFLDQFGIWYSGDSGWQQPQIC